MNPTLVIPGPETVVLLGVHVPALSAVFGLGGVLLGHLIKPPSGERLGWGRTLAVLAGGALASLSITIATGQRPLIVLGWSIGIGFSGPPLFAVVGAQVSGAARTLGDAVIEGVAARIAAKRDGK